MNWLGEALVHFVRENRVTVQVPKTWLISSSIVALTWVVLASFAQAQEAQFEEPPVLEAAKYLDAEVLKGDHHTVRDAVVNDGYMNTYTIDSAYGEFEAYGSSLLAIRLQEIGAFAELDELSKTKVFADAVAKGARAQVEAVKTFAEKPVETVKGVPGGVKRMFKRTKRTVKKGAESAKEFVNDDDVESGDGDGSAADDGESNLEKGAEAGQKYAKKYFGVSGAERRWAEKLGVDPYTSNEALKREIEKVARVDAAGSFAVRLAPIPKIPGVGYIQDVSKLVWRTDPWELREINQKALVAMGIEPELAERFLDNPWYNPSAQTFLVSVLSALDGADGRGSVVEQAAVAESQDEGLFFVQAIHMLAGFESTGAEITELVGVGRLPGVVTGDNRLVFLIPVDHIFWTEGIAVAADGSLAEDGQELETTSREVWFRGKASARCREELEQRGWLVRDQVRFAAPVASAEG